MRLRNRLRSHQQQHTQTDYSFPIDTVWLAVDKMGPLPIGKGPDQSSNTDHNITQLALFNTSVPFRNPDQKRPTQFTSMLSPKAMIIQFLAKLNLLKPFSTGLNFEPFLLEPNSNVPLIPPADFAVMSFYTSSLYKFLNFPFRPPELLSSLLFSPRKISMRSSFF